MKTGDIMKFLLRVLTSQVDTLNVVESFWSDTQDSQCVSEKIHFLLLPILGSLSTLAASDPIFLSPTTGQF